MQILHTIHSFLGVGTVAVYKDYCVYKISSVTDIVKVLIPLLDTYTLYTTKFLDYLDFKQAVNLLVSLPTSRLQGANLEFIKSLISGMNSGRQLIDYSTIPTFVFNAFWFLGFVEGEGTFGLKNLVPYFQIGQHNRNIMVLEGIAAALSALPNMFGFTLNSKPPVVSNTLNQTTNVNVLAISNVDALYDYLAYFFLSMQFQTRKSVDFYYWCICLYMHKYGYAYLPEGRALLVKIAAYINSSRYSTASSPAIQPLLAEVQHVLSLQLPIALQPHMTHLLLAQACARLMTTREVWVYDNGALVTGSPFMSYAAAQEAIGISRTSVAVRRNIDTNKAYLGRYKFYSTKQT